MMFWDHGSAPVMMRVEAVGRWYEARVSHVTGGSHGGGSGAGVGDSSSDEDSEDSSGSAGQGSGDEGDDDAVVNPLLLDPTQWKVGEITS